MRYPAQFEVAPEGGFVITFRDIPEAITQGDSEEEAMEMAVDVLVSAMDFYFDDKRPVPLPSEALKGERLIELPPGLSAKILLLNEMLAQRVTFSELARRLGTTPQHVQRIADIHHATKIDTIGQAFSKLGKHLEISIY